MSPAHPGFKAIVNYDAFTQPLVGDLLMQAYRRGKAVMGNFVTYEGIENGNAAAFVQLSLAKGQYRFNDEELLLDPSTGMSYPVFDSFDRSTRRVVGTFGFTLYWKFYLRNILPPNARGIYCVVSNTKNQSVTFRIDGAEAEYVGFADLHDSRYDDYEHSLTLGDFVKGLKSASTLSYTSVDIDFTYNDYTVRVYPSQGTEEQFRNNDPWAFALVIVGVFVFTSLVFAIYDFLVARRQHIVMNRAVASSAIVSSLYPSQVRDQIYNETEKNTKGVGDDRAVKNLMSGEVGLPSASRNAHVYPSTTILFADLAGFTKWSSTRKPEQVFELLETIYSSFDRIASKRKVYKIETIGDCYVAVTGCPEPQENHAVIMVKFADDCLVKLGELTKSLADSLGSDTESLQLRVGLHSGSVTGGCLRGQKARFQLFGDTMNTASRMESNGVGGRIHCSQETADELYAKGKNAWVVPREDKIIAKGKGEMQTYYIVPRRTASSACSRTNTHKSDSTNDAPPSLVKLNAMRSYLTEELGKVPHAPPIHS